MNALADWLFDDEPHEHEEDEADETPVHEGLACREVDRIFRERRDVQADLAMRLHGMVVQLAAAHAVIRDILQVGRLTPALLARLRALVEVPEERVPF